MVLAQANNSCNLQFLLHYHYTKTAGVCSRPLFAISACAEKKRRARKWEIRKLIEENYS
jgi:hypothetical protein